MKTEKSNVIYTEMPFGARLWKLFISTVSISAVAFGGGLTILPLLQRRYVEKYKWLSGTELGDSIALAQSSPGAIVTNTTMLIGYKVAGILGSVVTMIASIIPPVAIMTGVFYLYEAIRDNEIFANIMAGLQAGVAAVIIDVVYKMCKERIKEKNILGLLIMVASFILTFFVKFNVLYTILIAAALGIGAAYYAEFKARKEEQTAKVAVSITNNASSTQDNILKDDQKTKANIESDVTDVSQNVIKEADNNSDGKNKNAENIDIENKNDWENEQ